jgi:hypothetical protein
MCVCTAFWMKSTFKYHGSDFGPVNVHSTQSSPQQSHNGFPRAGALVVAESHKLEICVGM